MGIRRWLKQLVMHGDDKPGEAGLPAELRLVRLYRTIRDFPGRTEGDLARMIYGHADPDLLAQDSNDLAARGMIVREADTGRLFAVGGLHV